VRGGTSRTPPRGIGWPRLGLAAPSSTGVTGRPGDSHPARVSGASARHPHFYGSLAVSVGDSRASGERWTEAAKAEHGQGDDRLGVMEAEAAADDQADLGVEALDPRVGEPVEERCLDPLAIRRDGGGQLDEGLEPALLRPA